MLHKNVVALTATLFLASASSAFSYEDPEARLGDRYPFLEQTRAPSVLRLAQSRTTTAPISAGARLVYEDPENRIADRYALLEPVTRPAASSVAAGRYLAMRYAAAASRNQVRVEDPEGRLADRYPFLEQRAYPSRVAGLRHSRVSTTGTIR